MAWLPPAHPKKVSQAKLSYEIGSAYGLSTIFGQLHLCGSTVVPFPAGRLMPHLHHCLICLISAIVLGTSSSLVPLLVSHWHHLVCHSVLLCLSSSSPPLPHALHCHCPVHLVSIT